MFKGSMVAIVTPMFEDGRIDKKTLQALIEWHIDAKTDAIIVAGTTGESATLTHEEQQDLIRYVVKEVNGRIPVIAGTGTNSTHTTIELTQKAKEVGVDACLIVTPYYNKPPQNGLYEHYRKITESCQIPIILYNVPSRTASDMLPETVLRVADLKNVVGIKEATGDVERTKAILAKCRSDFVILSGDDATALSLMEAGAKGVISVTANVAPYKMHLLTEAALKKDFEIARKIDKELALLHKHLFLESNPIPTKWALNKMNKIKAGIRLPLLQLNERYHAQVEEAIEAAGVT